MESTFRQEWSNDLPPAVPRELQNSAQHKVEELSSQLNAWMSGKDAQQRRLLQGLKDFLMVNDRKVYPWNSNFLMPTVYNAVRATFARFFSSILGSPKLAEIKPYGMVQTGFAGDYEELVFRARLADSAFNAALDLGRTRRDIAIGGLDSLIFGVNWCKTGWITQGRPDGYGGMDVESEWPKGIRVSPFNVYEDPYCGMNLSKARAIHEILELTEEELRSLARSNQFIPQAWTKCQEVLEGTTNAYRRRANDLRKVTTGVTASGYYEVVESHCYWDHDGDGTPTPWVFWWDLASRNLLGCRENPFKHGQFPYQRGVPLWVPEMGGGIGLSEALHPQMQAHSSAVNQIQENLAAQNIRHLILAGQVDRVALSKSIPNGIIECEDINAYKPLQAEGMPPDTWNFLSFWAGLAQETSGVTPLTMAMKAASTAYGTSAVQSNAQENFDSITSILSVTWLDPMFEQLFSITQQFLDLGVLVNMPVKGFEHNVIPVSRKDIQGKFHVEPCDLRLFGRKMQRAQQAQSMLSQLVQLKLPGNYEWLTEQIFGDMELYDSDEFFKGKIWNPMTEEAKAAAMAKQAPMQPLGQQPATAPGYPGQPNANDVRAVQPDPGSQRLALRPGPGGAMPQDLQGLLGGGEPQ